MYACHFFIIFLLLCSFIFRFAILLSTSDYDYDVITSFPSIQEIYLFKYVNWFVQQGNCSINNCCWISYIFLLLKWSIIFQYFFHSYSYMCFIRLQIIWLNTYYIWISMLDNHINYAWNHGMCMNHFSCLMRQSLTNNCVFDSREIRSDLASTATMYILYSIE